MRDAVDLSNVKARCKSLTNPVVVVLRDEGGRGIKRERELKKRRMLRMSVMWLQQRKLLLGFPRRDTLECSRGSRESKASVCRVK